VLLRDFGLINTKNSLKSCSGYQETEEISNCKSIVFHFAILVELQPVCQISTTALELVEQPLTGT
jgi:hypothetical protein